MNTQNHTPRKLNIKVILEDGDYFFSSMNATEKEVIEYFPIGEFVTIGYPERKVNIAQVIILNSDKPALQPKDLLPPITAYTNYLSEASKKFNISVNECRNRFGSFTEGEWECLLKSEIECVGDYADMIGIYASDEDINEIEKEFPRSSKELYKSYKQLVSKFIFETLKPLTYSIDRADRVMKAGGKQTSIERKLIRMTLVLNEIEN